jgi:hypothetical protein
MKKKSQIILCINHSNAFKDCKYKNIICRIIWNKETNKSIRIDKTKLLQRIGHKVQGHKEKCVDHMHFQTISLEGIFLFSYKFQLLKQQSQTHDIMKQSSYLPTS